MGYTKSVQTEEAHYFEKSVLSVMNTNPDEAFVWPTLSSVSGVKSAEYNCTPYEAVTYVKRSTTYAAAEYAAVLVEDRTAQINN